jgi:hypothetical protein
VDFPKKEAFGMFQRLFNRIRRKITHFFFGRNAAQLSSALDGKSQGRGSENDPAKRIVALESDAKALRKATAETMAPPLTNRPYHDDDDDFLDLDPEDDEDFDSEPAAPTETEVEHTDERPLPAPSPAESRKTVLYTHVAGPRGSTPEEIDMTNPNPGPQVPPNQPKPPGGGSVLAALAIAAAAVAGLVVTMNFHNPATPQIERPKVDLAVHATQPPAPERPPEIPMPPQAYVPAESDDAAELPLAAADANPTTGYEDDEEPIEPTSEVAEAVSGHVPPLPIPVTVVAPVPAPKPVTVAAATKPSTSVTDGFAKPGATAAAITPKPAAPDSLVVTATGRTPACKAECAWADTDPSNGFPKTVGGKRSVTCGDATYDVTAWTKIADGPQKYCYTVTGITPK